MRASSKGEHVQADHPDVLRAKRAHLNAIENAVPFFVVGLAYAMLGPSKLGAQAFAAARRFHSVFYLLRLQPCRTSSFAIGALATFGMAFHVIRAAL